MNIRDYVPYSRDGQDWTEAFLRAIGDLRQQGGGVLTVPAGEYPTGSIRLYDNMTLCIEAGAALRFHQDEAAFPLIELEFEGNAGLVHQACIYAEKAENVTVTGYGTVDGQGSYWWRQIRESGRTAHPRPYLVCFSDCRHVVLGSEMSGDIRNVVVSSCVFFYGLAEMPVAGVSMQDVVVEMTDGPSGRPAMMDGCPDMSKEGFFLRNAVNVELRGVDGEWLDIDESVQLEA